MAATSALGTLRMDLWEGDTTELTRAATKGVIPTLRPIAKPYQTVIGPMPVAYYMALQIQKTQDKDVVMRALASATAVVLGKRGNFTGSTDKPEELTGLQVALDDTVADDTIIRTNFADEEEVTKGELVALMEADEDELGAYLGVLFIAGNKKLTAQNRTAFNERRHGSATAGVIGDAKIFTPDSPLLDDLILQKLNASFNSRLPLRGHMTVQAIACLPDATMGAAQAFSNQFQLLVDSGMGGLRVIRQVTGMYAWTRAAFPELTPQFNAANTAFKLIRSAPADQRPFLKAIHGNHFVPVSYSQIENLVGVCKHVMTYHSATFGNYGGGSMTEAQRNIVETKMSELGIQKLSGEDDDNRAE